MSETIVLLRAGTGMNFNRYVDRVFQSAETARKWRNAQYENHTIRRLEGRWKTGQVVPFATPTKPLDP